MNDTDSKDPPFGSLLAFRDFKSSDWSKIAIEDHQFSIFFDMFSDLQSVRHTDSKEPPFAALEAISIF